MVIALAYSNLQRYSLLLISFILGHYNHKLQCILVLFYVIQQCKVEHTTYTDG